MGWLDQIGGLLQRYAGGGQAHDNVHDDFNQFAQHAPPNALAHGIGDAFRSDQTPPFPQMVAQMFGHADPNQRAGLMNTLMGAVGPQVLQHVMGGMFGGGQVTPQMASQVPPQMVEQLAAYAEQQNPSIVDHLSGYFAQHPGVFQQLGPAAMGTALSGLAYRQQQGVLPASQDPYGDPADQYGGQYMGQQQYGGQQVFPASQDPYGDPADQQVLPASQDPYGDPADQQNVRPASEDPYGDPADEEMAQPRRRGMFGF